MRKHWPLRATLIVGSLVVSWASALAQETTVPAPRAVIYPGDVITDQMLADLAIKSSEVDGGIWLRQREAAVGKAARRTLLPNRPIPVAALENPRLVRNGGGVTLVFVEGGLTITTNGSALQDGASGETIKVRNSDSGVTISGIVQPDGSVRVRGG